MNMYSRLRKRNNLKKKDDNKRKVKEKTILISSSEEENNIEDYSRVLFSDESSNDISKGDESTETNYSKDLFSQCKDDSDSSLGGIAGELLKHNINDCNVVLTDVAKTHPSKLKNVSEESTKSVANSKIDQNSIPLKTKCNNNDSDMYLADLKALKGERVDEKKVADDSSMTFDNVESIKKFKTFKTYGKCKFQRRKLSIEWTSAKKAVNSNVHYKNNIWGKNDENISHETNLDKDEIVGLSTPHGKVNNKILTPNLQGNINCLGSPKVHSTPLHIRTKICKQIPSSNKLKYNKELSHIFDSPCGRFSRTICFENNENLAQSFLKADKTNPYHSLSFLKAESFVATKDASIVPIVVPIETRILNLCEQDNIQNFKDYVDDCKFTAKIAEGSYGEVFERKDENGESIIVKVVPVGLKDVLVNGIPQMSLDEIIPEMVISKTLSDLEDVKKKKMNFRTDGFIKVHRLVFCKGKYPQRLIKLWESWDDDNESENTNPRKLSCEQMYIVFETDYCGVDLEHYKVKTQVVAMSILKQAIASLAIAEKLYQFEHRDLHWGNLLIMETEKSEIDFIVDGTDYSIESHGVNVSIIDFTVSRIQGDGCVLYTELCDEVDLFEGKGDIQFNVYRDMKKHNKNNWSLFSPYTNVLWIHYLVKKLISKSRNKNRLKQFEKSVLDYESAYDILISDEIISE